VRALRMKHPTIVALSKKYSCTPGMSCFFPCDHTLLT
jgi:hypothetical protein